jgi:hypothetical protein
VNISTTAEDEKRKVWDRIQSIHGDLTVLGRSDGWRGKEDKSLSVFLTFSKYYDSSKSYWYDININNITKWLEYEHAFAVFVAGDYETTFVVPAREIQVQIDLSSKTIPDSGNYGIHIKRSSNSSFEIIEFSDFDLDKYLLRYDLLASNPCSSSKIDQNWDDIYELGEDIGTKRYYEGALTRITVNSYERNPRARRVCIQYHGLSCAACGFNFADRFGDIGLGFIHVHHLKPLSEIREGYELDPINDLSPVCPNCHAMLHRRRPAYSIEELKIILRSNTKKI